MNSAEYNRLVRQINSPSDIKRLSRESGLDPDLLLVLYTQKTIRSTKRSFYEVKRKAPSLIRDWMHGKRFTQISDEEGFPPVLTASIMLQHTGLSKKQFKNYLKNPAAIGDKRLRREIEDVLKAELIYSPEGNRIQHERGKDVEKIVQKWLDKRIIKYLTEYDAKKGEYTKTPDFNLEAPMKLHGRWLNWVECKASFGDETEYKRDYSKQLSHYVSLFGPGMVVYWYGFIEDMPSHLTDKNILIMDKTLFQD
jgi:CDAN1-interacting nuclease 1